MSQKTASDNAYLIKVDHQFMGALSELAARLNKTEADVIRDALNYYSNAVYEWDRKHHS